MPDTTEPTLDADRLRELRGLLAMYEGAKADYRAAMFSASRSRPALFDKCLRVETELGKAAVNALPSLLDRLDRLTKASRLVVRAAHDSTMVTDEWVKQTLEPALDEPSLTRPLWPWPPTQRRGRNSDAR